MNNPDIKVEKPTKETLPKKPDWRILLVPVVGAFICMGIAYYFSNIENRLENESTIVDGLITELKKQSRSTSGSSSSNKDVFRVWYEFDTGKGLHRDNSEIHRQRYNNFKIGDKIPVRFVTEDPSINQVNKSNLAGTIIWAKIMIGVFLMMAIIGALIQYSQRKNLRPN